MEQDGNDGMVVLVLEGVSGFVCEYGRGGSCHMASQVIRLTPEEWAQVREDNPGAGLAEHPPPGTAIAKELFERVYAEGIGSTRCEAHAHQD